MPFKHYLKRKLSNFFLWTKDIFEWIHIKTAATQNLLCSFKASFLEIGLILMPCFILFLFLRRTGQSIIPNNLNASNKEKCSCKLKSHMQSVQNSCAKLSERTKWSLYHYHVHTLALNPTSSYSMWKCMQFTISF